MYPIHEKPTASFSFDRLDMLWERYPQYHERTTFSTMDALLEEHFHASISGIGLSDRDLARLSAAAALRYVYDTQMNAVEHIANIKYYSS